MLFDRGVEHPVVVNPEAVGNPDIDPIVRVDQATADWLTDPENGGCTECHGINWFHEPSCRKAVV
jgi:hypothetical protein